MTAKIKRELAGSAAAFGGALLCGLGLMLLLEAGALVFVRVSGEAWVGLGGVGFAVGALLVMFIVNIVSVSSSFSMALSMGCTRRAYFLSSECAMVLWTLAAALLALPAALADEALRPVLAPADARPLLEANPMLGLYRDHFWTVALGALSVVALGQFFGAVIWKWGVTGYWIIWGGSMLLGALASYAADARAGWLYAAARPLVLRCAAFSAAQWAALWAGAIAVLFLAVWLFLRRASLK